MTDLEYQQSCCDHDWHNVDDSFDHEYGTETVRYQRCALCDDTRNIPDTRGDDDVI